MTKLSKFRPSSTWRKVTWVRFHWNYIFISNFLILKCATASLKNCGRIIWTKYHSSVVFRNSFFRIKQLTMFAAHEVLYWFRVIHFYITIQSNQSNCNSIKRSWANSSHCCTIGTSARPNLAPIRFTTAVQTFALWWRSKGKYIPHFIAETSIAELSHSEQVIRNEVSARSSLHVRKQTSAVPPSSAVLQSSFSRSASDRAPTVRAATLLLLVSGPQLLLRVPSVPALCTFR